MLRRAVVLVLLALAGLVLHQWATWPDVAALARRDPETTAFIERWRARERAAGRPGVPDWRPVPGARIAEDLKLAVLVAEDIEFFQHRGFSDFELRSAISKAWAERRAPRGASTLTQQLAKNLWLSPSRDPLRKAKEALLTRALERDLPKGRILELYLNVVEFGPGVWGAEAAARRYFGRSAGSLGERQAAELAAALPRPSRWHPGIASAGYRSAVERTLGRMRRATWLRAEIRAHAR
jgi:monofunctional biosynthetic peptidoglycan transglycosylase